jgi:hypothetical protein
MAILTASSLLALTGCGGSASTQRGTLVELNDGQQLASLVTEFADTGSPLTMVKHFVPGTRIGTAEYRKYIAHNYRVDGKPAIEGDSATATVKVMTANDGRDVGAKEWAFAKQGNKWKLKSAPLP